MNDRRLNDATPEEWDAACKPLMTKSEETFEEYCHKMFCLNCEERSDWGDSLLSYDEYVATYNEFLLDSYQELS